MWSSKKFKHVPTISNQEWNSKVVCKSSTKFDVKTEKWSQGKYKYRSSKSKIVQVQFSNRKFALFFRELTFRGLGSTAYVYFVKIKRISANEKHPS